MSPSMKFIFTRPYFTAEAWAKCPGCVPFWLLARWSEEGGHGLPLSPAITVKAHARFQGRLLCPGHFYPSLIQRISWGCILCRHENLVNLVKCLRNLAENRTTHLVERRVESRELLGFLLKTGLGKIS